MQHKQRTTTHLHTCFCCRHCRAEMPEFALDLRHSSEDLRAALAGAPGTAGAPLVAALPHFDAATLFNFQLPTPARAADALSPVGMRCHAGPLLERAIGVIYRPRTERQSHYFGCSLPAQFDFVVHLDESSGAKPAETLGRHECALAECAHSHSNNMSGCCAAVWHAHDQFDCSFACILRTTVPASGPCSREAAGADRRLGARSGGPRGRPRQAAIHMPPLPPLPAIVPAPACFESSAGCHSCNHRHRQPLQLGHASRCIPPWLPLPADTYPFAV